MATSRSQPPIWEDEGTPVSILDDLGNCLRLSLEAASHEALPEEMGLLLLRLALAEVLKGVAAEEARAAGDRSLSDEWMIHVDGWSSLAVAR